jgi:hypothetical protein
MHAVPAKLKQARTPQASNTCKLLHDGAAWRRMKSMDAEVL